MLENQFYPTVPIRRSSDAAVPCRSSIPQARGRVFYSAGTWLVRTVGRLFCAMIARVDEDMMRRQRLCWGIVVDGDDVEPQRQN